MYHRQLLANTRRWTPVTAARTFSCSRNSSDWNKCKSHPFAGLVPRRYAMQTYCKTWVGRPVWERGYPFAATGRGLKRDFTRESNTAVLIQSSIIYTFGPYLWFSPDRYLWFRTQKLCTLKSQAPWLDFDPGKSCVLYFQAWLYLLWYMHS